MWNGYRTPIDRADYNTFDGPYQVLEEEHIYYELEEDEYADRFEHENVDKM